MAEKGISDVNIFNIKAQEEATVRSKQSIQDIVAKHRVVVFGRSKCLYTEKVKDLLQKHHIPFHVELVDQNADGCFQSNFLAITQQKAFPVVFINTKIIGGPDSVRKLLEEQKLLEMVKGPDPDQDFTYDLIVVGGGSGGLASAKQAAEHGMKVACLDFVTPSPAGSTWGLGGTCVNVGCIPKKLMHTACLLGEHIRDSAAYGWNVPQPVTHDWDKMRQSIQDYIGSLNWNYRTQLRSKDVKYFNCLGKFIGPHRISATNKKGKVEELTSRYFIVATGGRPKYPRIAGCPEYCISSDDIFSLSHPPGKTVVVGASYVALECAGFLAGLGYEVVVMVRSILLRGFDQQCAELIGEYMKTYPNLRFLRPCIPTKVEKISEGVPPKLRVHGEMLDAKGKTIVEDCNTVLMAIGRDPCTKGLGFENVGVELNSKTLKVLHQPDESTTCPYVYCVGDILDNKPELTPVAIHAGRLLARRLLGKTTALTDYINIPTTVFTPLEYGCIGLSEEEAIEKYGEKGIEVFHSYYTPLEWTLPNKEKNFCYAKLICSVIQHNRVVGLHVTGPNAGEITQGFTLALKAGLTKDAFDDAIGIHPTCAEIFTSLAITKSSGVSADVEGC